MLIQSSTGFGSGFVASSDGFVLTAAHVVSGSAATVRLRDGRELPATVVRSDRRLDIALLRVAVLQGVTLSCLPIVSGVASAKKTDCEAVDGGRAGNYDCSNYNASLYGGLLSAVALVGIGVPLIVVGGKKVPVNDDRATAHITPWMTPHAGGVGSRVDL